MKNLDAKNNMEKQINLYLILAVKKYCHEYCPKKS